MLERFFKDKRTHDSLLAVLFLASITIPFPTPLAEANEIPPSPSQPEPITLPLLSPPQLIESVEVPIEQVKPTASLTSVYQEAIPSIDFSEIKKTQDLLSPFFEHDDFTEQTILTRLWTETTGFDSEIESNKKAIGLMQITPDTAMTVIKKIKTRPHGAEIIAQILGTDSIEQALKNPKKNLFFGTAIEMSNFEQLKNFLRVFDQQTRLVFLSFAYHNGVYGTEKKLQTIFADSQKEPFVSSVELAKIEIARMERGDFGPETAKNIRKTMLLYAINNALADNKTFDKNYSITAKELNNLKKFAENWMKQREGEDLNMKAFKLMLSLEF